MKRRACFRSLLTLVAASSPLRSAAQASPPRVVFVHQSPEAASRQWIAAFRNGLREHGYVVGRDVIVDDRFSEGRSDQLPAIFRQVVDGKPDVIVTGGSQAAWAARAATSTIPIVVMSIASPVEQGFVPSLARPGGNVTGIAILEETIGAKALETLRLVLPAARRVVWLRHSDNPVNTVTWPRLAAAARELEFELLLAEAANADQFATAFDTILKLRPDALRIGADALFLFNREPLLAFATRNRIPTLVPDRSLLVDGGLISFNSSLAWRFHRAAYFVHRILQGLRPSELPFEQPAKFELLINLKTAKALGITIPASVLLRADEVVQ